jgi:hypothetical protein
MDWLINKSLGCGFRDFAGDWYGACIGQTPN